MIYYHYLDKNKIIIKKTYVINYTCWIIIIIIKLIFNEQIITKNFKNRKKN